MKRPGTPAPTSNEIAVNIPTMPSGVRDRVNHLTCCLGFAGGLVSPSNRAAFILFGFVHRLRGHPQSQPCPCVKEKHRPPIPLVPRVEERPGRDVSLEVSSCGCGPEGSPPSSRMALRGLRGEHGAGAPREDVRGPPDGGAQGRRLGATEA